MAIFVSPQACVDPKAELEDEVYIGPFCVVGPDVHIGRGTRLENSVTLIGHVTLGEYNHLWPGTVIGGEPQDISYSGTPTRVVVGDHNKMRECVTINRGTEKEDGVTCVGSYNFLMACSHVAHDCQVGNHCILTNNCLLGGHVHVHDHATLSGAVAVHHFATIGCYAFVAGCCPVRHDVPPYMLAEGFPSRPRCVNLVALKRNNFSPEVINALSEAHRLLYRARVGLEQTREILRGKDMLGADVNHLLNFIEFQREGRHGRGREHRRAA